MFHFLVVLVHYILLCIQIRFCLMLYYGMNLSQLILFDSYFWLLLLLCYMLNIFLFLIDHIYCILKHRFLLHLLSFLSFDFLLLFLLCLVMFRIVFLLLGLFLVFLFLLLLVHLCCLCFLVIVVHIRYIPIPILVLLCLMLSNSCLLMLSLLCFLGLIFLMVNFLICSIRFRLLLVLVVHVYLLLYYRISFFLALCCIHIPKYRFLLVCLLPYLCFDKYTLFLFFLGLLFVLG